MDQRLLAAPHGFSQRATSFIASWCQGIHRTPLSCSHHVSGEPKFNTPTLHRNHPIHHEISVPSKCCPFGTGYEKYPNLRDRRAISTSILSLTLLNIQAAGTWDYSLLRSDMRPSRADAPNPDSQLKEQRARTSRPRPHARPSPAAFQPTLNAHAIPIFHCDGTSLDFGLVAATPGSPQRLISVGAPTLQVQNLNKQSEQQPSSNPNGGGRYRTDDPLLAKQVLSH